MRIISGSRRGLKLKAPDGKNTRPTTDRVKESVFNIIQFTIPCDSALDLFAGSGALGIEAISRGCKSCTFVDSNKASVSLIAENLKAAGFQDKAKLIETDAISFLLDSLDQFDLIFLDPPYNKGLLEPVIKLIFQRNLLKKDGLLVVESERGGEMAPTTYYDVRRTATYGKTVITILQG